MSSAFFFTVITIFRLLYSPGFFRCLLIRLNFREFLTLFNLRDSIFSLHCPCFVISRLVLISTTQLLNTLVSLTLNLYYPTKGSRGQLSTKFTKQQFNSLLCRRIIQDLELEANDLIICLPAAAAASATAAAFVAVRLDLRCHYFAYCRCYEVLKRKDQETVVHAFFS